jgi:hypothetical protein
MLQLMEDGIGNTSSTAQTAKIFKLPDRTARGAPNGEDRAPEGPEFVRAAYEAAGGSCAKPVEMRPLGRRLGLERRAVENLAMRLQAERLVRVVSMANGLLRLTPEGVRAAEGAASDPPSDPPQSAGSGPPDPAAPIGAPRAGGNFAGTRTVPVVGRGALRVLEEMLDPLKADLDRLDLDGVLDEDQRSELAAEIHTIEAQLGSPRPNRRIVVAALESVGGVVGSVDGAAGGAESERISSAIDGFLDEAGGAGQTGRAAPGVGGGAGEAAGKTQAGRAAQGARNGAGLAWPGSDLADDEDEWGPWRPEEESVATVRAREAEEATTVRRVVDEAGDILRITLNEDGEVVAEDVVGNVADLPIEDEHVDERGRTVAGVKDDAGVVEPKSRDADRGPEPGLGKQDTPEQRSHDGHTTAGEGRTDGAEPDVLLDVPNLEAENLLVLKAENLSARASLLAELANVVKVDVELDARLDEAELGLKGAKARASFGVRLKRILDTFDRALGAIDRNPQILGGTLGGAGGDALHGKGGKDTPEEDHGAGELEKLLGDPGRDGPWGFERDSAVK